MPASTTQKSRVNKSLLRNAKGIASQYQPVTEAVKLDDRTAQHFLNTEPGNTLIAHLFPGRSKLSFQDETTHRSDYLIKDSKRKWIYSKTCGSEKRATLFKQLNQMIPVVWETDPTQGLLSRYEEFYKARSASERSECRSSSDMDPQIGCRQTDASTFEPRSQQHEELDPTTSTARSTSSSTHHRRKRPKGKNRKTTREGWTNSTFLRSIGVVAGAAGVIWGVKSLIDMLDDPGESAGVTEGHSAW